MRRFFLSLALLIISAAVVRAAEPATWAIDPGHSHVGFSVRHMMVSNTRGSFEKFSGAIVGDPDHPTGAKIDVTIDAASLNTQNPKRDDHLRSADFFDVAKYPTITFQSKRVDKRADGSLRVIGDLTMRGVTKEVVLDVDGPTPAIQVGAATRIGASATTKLNRRDFGLTWNRVLEAGGVTVGDEVKITIELELIKNRAETSQP